MRNNWSKNIVVCTIMILFLCSSALSALSTTLTQTIPAQDTPASFAPSLAGDIILSNPVPANGSQNVPLQPSCNITIQQTAGAGMNLYWYENSTGAWVLRQFQGSPNWYNPAWKYRKLLTINHHQILSPLTQFPMLVTLSSDTDLAADAQDDGDDIVFIQYSDNTTKLHHELEWFNGATGKLSAWVNIPQVSSTTDTKLWMYYGNSLCSNQENPPLVWDEHYGGVWHMQEINAQDSTSNTNHGSQSGNPLLATGVVNNSVDFTPIDSINVGTGSSINTADDNTLTWECWIKGDSTAANQIFLEQSRWFSSWNVVLGTYDGDVSGNAIKWITRDDDGSNRDTLSSGVSITVGAWMHLAGTYNNGASDNKSVYINGVLKAWTNTGINNLRSGPITATHFGYGGDYGPYNGKIDEVRMSDAVRSPGWINATYQTIAHPASFFSLGSEQHLLLNGTYQWSFTQATAYERTYYWKVLVDDTTQTKTAVYHFTTMAEPNHPPYPPSTPSPANGSLNVSITTDLSWTCSDPDGDPLTYDVYFGTSTNPPKVASNISTIIYDLGTLLYSTSYYWRIVAWDNHGATTPGPLWWFTTEQEPNQPPTPPTNPNPPNGATNVTINGSLSWTCSDPNGDPLTYDVYFGTSSSPPKVAANITTSNYGYSGLTYNTLYYWRIIAWDTHSASTSGPLWQFTTGAEPNNPPYPPSSPSPANGAINIPIQTILCWQGGDPDPGDTVSYDVYFGTSSTPPLVSSHQPELSYDPGSLSYNTWYYWRIVAWDTHGASTSSPLWSFKTIADTHPPYQPSNPSPANGSTDIPVNTVLTWSGGDPDPGDYVTYDVYLGSNLPLTKIKANISGTTCTVGPLNYSTTYSWMVVAWDNHGASTRGPLWQFTTKTDLTPPSIKLLSPKIGYLNINIGDFIIKEIPILLGTIVMGKAEITATVEDYQSGVQTVEFYLNNEPVANFTEPPYSYPWGFSGLISPYTLRIVAIDNLGNDLSSEVRIWKIF